MSAFYDQASLVVVPSGYKSGKIYAQKPLTTDGQLTFSRASTATRVNASGLIETVASNVPRLDYLGSTCPKLLLEPQRTNVVPYSQQLSQWSLTNATLTSNDAISPDGTQNADKIVTTSAGCDVKYVNVSVSASTTYTASFWVKLTSGSGLQGRFYDNTNSTNIEYYVYDSQLTIGEWSRVTRTFTTPAGCTSIQVWYLASSSSSSVTAHFWGFQAEVGAYATSYIPTTTAAVTRLADSFSRNDLFTNGLVSAAGGTLFLDFRIPLELRDNGNEIVAINDSTSQNSLFIYGGSSPFTYIIGKFISGVFSNAYFSLVSPANNIKIAIKWNGTSADIFQNGVKVVSATAFTATTSLQFLRSNSSGVGAIVTINQSALFPTPLTDAQCVELTTL
jgi:hypothetical protein